MSRPMNSRENLLKKIELLHEERLEKVLHFIEELEREERVKRLKSYAGMLEDFDKDVMDDLTINLHNTRLKDSLTF